MKAVLLISHGSKLFETKGEIIALIKKLKQKSGLSIFEYAFLEIETPNIPKGIDICVQKGASEVVVLLNFLNSGKHVNVDIPHIIKEAKKKYKDVKFHITAPVGHHPQMVDLFLNMI